MTPLFETAGPALIISDEDSLPQVSRVAERLGLKPPVLFDQLVEGVAPLPAPLPPARFALLQFTSGSSGNAKGVRVTHEALRANVTAMRRWLRWTPDLPGITWLPVHHDMGLIGCLMNIVTTGCDGWMMQPEDFIRSPSRYLRCISDQRVGLAAMPNFGLAYLLRRVKTADLEGLRFDSLRSVILGAERIDPRALTGVEDLLGPNGFDRRAFLPAYGGAEATLAVTGLPLDEDWTALAPSGSEGTAAPIVGCGCPLEGVEVEVIDDDGAVVADGTVGEIVVRGASVATDYVGRASAVSGTTLADGTLRTGDAGFLRDGQLFVVGRLGDGLKVRGRMVFAESLEALLHQKGIPERRVAVLLGVRDGVNTAAVVFETPKPEWFEVAVAVLREWLVDTELLRVEVGRGGLAVTSSGKPRRRVMWQALTMRHPDRPGRRTHRAGAVERPTTGRHPMNSTAPSAVGAQDVHDAHRARIREVFDPFRGETDAWERDGHLPRELFAAFGSAGVFRDRWAVGPAAGLPWPAPWSRRSRRSTPGPRSPCPSTASCSCTRCTATGPRGRRARFRTRWRGGPSAARRSPSRPAARISTRCGPARDGCRTVAGT